MGGKIVTGCCETRNESSSLNLKTESIKAFEYQDDEQINLTPFPLNADQNVKKLSLVFPTNYLYLSSTAPCELPVCLQLETYTLDKRPGTDLLVLVDLSSYSVSWLETIKEFLLNAVKLISENDRMSIVGFNTKAYKLSGLVAGNYSGILKLTRLIKDLHAEGDLDIIEGLTMGLLVLKNRIFINTNTSVILLSSGPDTYNNTVLERAEHLPQSIKDLNSCLYILGLGNHHNPELLNYLSASGAYTYINSPESLSNFRSILNPVFKKKLPNLSVSLSVSSVLPVEISKVFNYKKTLELGKTLNVLFIITVNMASDDVKDKVHVNAKVSYKFDSLETSNSIDVFGKMWNLENVKINGEVLVKYYKEKTVEVLMLASRKEMDVVVRIIDGLLAEISESPVENNLELDMLLEKLEKLRRFVEDNRSSYDLNLIQIYSFIAEMSS